jgi:hypothetical protein
VTLKRFLRPKPLFLGFNSLIPVLVQKLPISSLQAHELLGFWKKTAKVGHSFHLLCNCSLSFVLSSARMLIWTGE